MIILIYIYFNHLICTRNGPICHRCGLCPEPCIISTYIRVSELLTWNNNCNGTHAVCAAGSTRASGTDAVCAATSHAQTEHMLFTIEDHCIKCGQACANGMHAYMHTCMHSYMHACMHECMHSCMHDACMHVCMHT